MHWSNQSNQLKIKIKFFGPEDFSALIVGLFINPFLYVLGFYLCFKLLAMKKGITPMELLRRILKGTVNGKRVTYSASPMNRISLFKIATSYLPSLFFLALFVPFSQPATAGFEIIDTEKKPEILKQNSHVPFSLPKSGVGNDVRLENVVNVLIERPWKYKFVSKELQALRVSWLSRDNAVSEVIAQLGRNYGIESYYVETAGEVHIDWASGFCAEKIVEEKRRRDAFNQEIMFGAKDQSFPSVFKVKRDERVYLC